MQREVKEIVTRGGSRGELTQVMCQILDGTQIKIKLLGGTSKVR